MVKDEIAVCLSKLPLYQQIYPYLTTMVS